MLSGGSPRDVMWSGTCSDKHPVACAPGGGGGGSLYDQSGGVLDAVLAAVSAGDALEAYRVVLRQPRESPVHFVPERTAIQVRGCGEHVVAHISLAHLATAGVSGGSHSRPAGTFSAIAPVEVSEPVGQRAPRYAAMARIRQLPPSRMLDARKGGHGTTTLFAALMAFSAWPLGR